MKRLTISMSDALFSKLDQVENKSLFIRKLIEDELRKGITYSSDATYETLVDDIEDLHHAIRSLSSRLMSIEDQIADMKTNPLPTKDKLESDQIVSYQIPFLSSSENGIEAPIIQTNVMDSCSMDSEPNDVADKGQDHAPANASDIQADPYVQDNDKVLPVHTDELHNMPFRSVVNVEVHKEPICPIIKTNEPHVDSVIITPNTVDNPQDPFPAQADGPSAPSFIIPDLSDVATLAPPNVASSEPSVPSSPSYVQPELSNIVHPNISPFETPPVTPMPDSINDIQIPSFTAAGPEMQMAHVPLCGPDIFQSPTQKNDSFKVSSGSSSMNERLQGNILMYLPHGARIKRSIIKGLVSKKFSAEEIDNEINLMVSVHSLQLEVENGVEYLLRP